VPHATLPSVVFFDLALLALCIRYFPSLPANALVLLVACVPTRLMLLLLAVHASPPLHLIVGYLT
jgi:hypothetical protein